ncbi:MAG: hypothetical protein ACOYN8_18715 [Pseudanabaena sp.]
MQPSNSSSDRRDYWLPRSGHDHDEVIQEYAVTRKQILASLAYFSELSKTIHQIRIAV